jgi:hypothetical protein
MQDAFAKTATRLPDVRDGTGSDAVLSWGDEIEAVTTFSCSWNDQGWGNRKGMIFAKTSEGEWTPLSANAAPHASERLDVMMPEQLSRARLQFGYRVGGGGGHALMITNAVINGAPETQTDISDAIGGMSIAPVSSAALASAPSTPDISQDGFRGFGRRREVDDAAPADAPLATLPVHLRGNYEVRTQWNGTSELVIAAERLLWKDVHVVPQEILFDTLPAPLAAPGATRMRFTVFCPNQQTEWLHGCVGVIESFDVTFSADGASFSGVFRRQGEGVLSTEGERKASLEERVASMPAVVRSESDDPEAQCPICLSEWDEPGVVQTLTECGHNFCVRCVVSTCNMTPPNTSGTCPLCRQAVTLSRLKRVER